MNQDHVLDAMKQPLGRPERGLLRLGLVLNGTVSAGAWTAGALDALIEALDCWHDGKASDPSLPRHGVRLEIIGGASGGAVCAAIFARAMGFDFPHGPQRGNPFWDLWVEGLDISGMVRLEGEGDFGSPDDPAFPEASLLSGYAIRAAADALLAWPSGKAPRHRAWVMPTLRILMTQTNLRGIAYEVPLRSASAGARAPTAYRAHADHVTFALQPDSGAPGADLRDDEFALRPVFPADWRRLARHARASGAFPIGFPPVRLERPGRHYDWRAVMVPGTLVKGAEGERERASARRLKPVWEGGPPETYHYDAVDGGALNNSPFALVHQRMTGLGGALCRDELDPDGAIIVIDPLAASPRDPGAYPLDPQRGMAKVAGLLIPALVAQGRFSASELMLATDEAVASRHLFTAARKRRDGTEAWGEDALAGAGLGAFLGFLDRRIREHDFLLGRSNMRAWLRRHFVFNADSTLFSADAPRQVGTDAPIIPLVGAAQQALGQPSWPGGIRNEVLRGAVAARLGEAAGRQCGSRWSRATVKRLAAWMGTGRAMALVEKAIADLKTRA